MTPEEIISGLDTIGRGDVSRGGRVLFHRDYGEATGEVAASDPPTVSDYIHWLELRESSAALVDHLAKVRDIQSSMLRADAS